VGLNEALGGGVEVEVVVVPAGRHVRDGSKRTQGTVLLSVSHGRLLSWIDQRKVRKSTQVQRARLGDGLDGSEGTCSSAGSGRCGRLGVGCAWGSVACVGSGGRRRSTASTRTGLPGVRSGRRFNPPRPLFHRT
jgi:hypothetical protein